MLIAALPFFAAVVIPSPLSAVRAYLEALQTSGREKARKYLADRYVSRIRHIDRERTLEPGPGSDIGDFERVMRTKWTYRVLVVFEDSVIVKTTEDNDFYTLLGLGLRTQIESLSVRNGKIYRMDIAGYQHRRGVFSEEVARFESWLRGRPAASDRDVMEEGHILYTGKSATKLRRLLREYRKSRGE